MSHWENPEDVPVGVDVDIGGHSTSRVSGQDAMVQVLLVVERDVGLPEIFGANPESKAW